MLPTPLQQKKLNSGLTLVANKRFVHMCAATIGISHPDIVVETNTLSSVPPPDITYTLSISDSTINSGLLSALQLEAIIYACQVRFCLCALHFQPFCLCYCLFPLKNV